jgi:hypothetical protein
MLGCWVESSFILESKQASSDEGAAALVKSKVARVNDAHGYIKRETHPQSTQALYQYQNHQRQTQSRILSNKILISLLSLRQLFSLLDGEISARAERPATPTRETKNSH